MKLIWFASLLLCALVRADIEPRKLTQDVEDVNFHLGSTLLNLHLLARDHEVTADDELLIQELSLGQRNFLANLIKDALESFRPIVINGNDILPPLDPFHVDQIGPFDYELSGIRTSAEINNFRVEGLSWYVVDRVNFNPIRLTLGIHVTIPWLNFTGTYDASAAILVINHKAGGNYRMFLNRLEFGVDLRLGTNLSAGHLVLRELDIKIDIHDVVIQITGMTGSNLINSFINSFIQSVTQEFVQNLTQNLSRILSEQLFDIINDILKNFSLADILG